MKLNKNGFEKNIQKFQEHYRYTSRHMRPDWKRWLKKPWDSHAYVNLFVESRRLSPYLTGHIDAILYPVLIGLLIWRW